MNHQMRNTGANLWTDYYTLPHLYQNNQQARCANNGPPPNENTSDSNNDSTADYKEEQPRTPPHSQALQQSPKTMAL
jgi:hypothetical protein